MAELPAPFANVQRPMFWRLDGHRVVPMPDTAHLDYMDWWHATDRRVGCTQVTEDVQVSTVFLGIDSAVEGPPRLFETLVMGGPLSGRRLHAATWDDAEQNHHALVLACMLAVTERIDADT